MSIPVPRRFVRALLCGLTGSIRVEGPDRMTLGEAAALAEALADAINRAEDFPFMPDFGAQVERDVANAQGEWLIKCAKAHGANELIVREYVEAGDLGAAEGYIWDCSE
jgi:hypothetical protein